jgi:uncharacterized protein YajQ (UPF0234 family)
MPYKKFTKEFLYKLCNEQSITLLRNYDENELNSQKFIEFKCIKCNEATSKKFEFILKYNPTCHNCSCIDKGNKARKTMKTRYGVENISQLEEIKNKKKETTLKNYGVEFPSQSDIIKNKVKATCLQKYNVEYPQQSEQIRNKSKQTCLNNYGVEHPSQSKEIKQQIKETNLKNYGVEFASQNEDFKNRVKATCLQKYNVEYPQQSQQIRNKVKQTILNNYGVEYPARCKEIKEKMKETIKIKYGVEHYSQTDEFKEKCKQTSLKKYGVEHPTQNEEFMEKASKTAYKIKTYTFSSGKQIKCQGYEPFALDELVKLQEEDNIITGCKNVPTIWYNDNSGKKHRHYVDIFIPSQNKCIEVKSTWTLRKKKDNIFMKQNAAKELGYNYEIWVYDNKGNKVETFI